MSFRLRKKIDFSKTFLYDILITDWSIDIYFNHYASMCAYESDIEFEESVSMILNGHLVESGRKHPKLKKGLFASLRIYGNDDIYKSRRQYSIYKDDRTINCMVY